MDVRALVQELVKGVLPIGTGLPPHHWVCGPLHWLSITPNCLAIGLHFRLLQIGRQPAQCLSVGKDHPTGVAEHIGVPQLDQGQMQGNVLVSPGLREMPVHCPGSSQQGAERLRTGAKRDGQPHWAPEGKTPPNPVAKAKHAVFGNAHCGGALHIGRNRCQVVSSPVTQGLLEPGHGAACIGHGFLRRERLGNNDDQGAFGIQPL